MTDLDALKEDLAYLRERGDLAGALTATTAELHRLIEKVERLRKQNHALWAEIVRAAVTEERVAVVAYLAARGGICLDIADDIERGEHRREE